MVRRAQLTLRAKAQVERAAAWWVAHRHDAPGAIVDDLARALNILVSQPGIGTRWASRRRGEVRRLYLERVRYHVYYRVEPDAIVVLAFWHARRRRPPST